jgi:ATP-dependent Lhr-like helicase
MGALDVFSAPTRRWLSAFAARPRADSRLAGYRAWRTRAYSGADRPGKTLAAFLLGIDRLNETPGEGLRLLYVSPLKALNYDIERNLRSPSGLGSKPSVGAHRGHACGGAARTARTPPDI